MTWNILYYPGSIAAAPGNGVVDGFFIPRDTALPGITQATELNDANKERKVAYAIATQLYEALNPIEGKLGLTVARGTPIGVGDNRINQSFNLSTQFVVNHASNTLSVLPMPAGDIGQVSIFDAFPGAIPTNPGDAIPEAGVLIPDTLIQAYGGSIPADATSDARSWIDALYASMVANLDASSAVITSGRGAAVGFTPPANFTGTNAITGLTAEDLLIRSFFSVSYTLTLQLQLNQSLQTFDLAA